MATAQPGPGAGRHHRHMAPPSPASACRQSASMASPGTHFHHINVIGRLRRDPRCATLLEILNCSHRRAYQAFAHRAPQAVAGGKQLPPRHPQNHRWLPPARTIQHRFVHNAPRPCAQRPTGPQQAHLAGNKHREALTHASISPAKHIWPPIPSARKAATIPTRKVRVPGNEE